VAQRGGLEVPDLHRAFLAPLGDAVLWTSDLRKKPLDVDLALPLPPRLRVYAYNLVNADGRKRRNEHKIVVRVPGLRTGERGSFDFTGDRLVILCGYSAELDVFVLWDASLHPTFVKAMNIQVRSETVFNALMGDIVQQQRNIKTMGATETVLATLPAGLPRCLQQRIEI
jgi:hypothetical protein